MLSKNNYKERLHKMEPRNDRFSIRKFSIGAASVLIGSVFIGMSNGETVHADEAQANGDKATPADTTTSSAPKTPSKVIVTTTIDPKTLPKVDNAKQQVQSNEAAQVDNDKTSAGNKATADAPTSSKDEKAVADAQTDKQNSTSEEKMGGSNQPAVGNKTEVDASKNINSDGKTVVANNENKNIAQTTSLNVAKSKKLVNKEDAEVSLADNKSVIPEKSADLTNFQKAYSELEAKLPSMSEEDKTAALADLKKKFSSLSQVDKLALSKLNLTASNTTGKTTDVDSVDSFLSALRDKDTAIINLIGDVDFTGAKLSNGFSKNWEKISNDGIARKVTIEGNNHTLDMADRQIGFQKANQTDSNWNITFKDLTLTLKDNGSNDAFAFNSSNSGNSLTYDHVTINTGTDELVSSDNVSSVTFKDSTINAGSIKSDLVTNVDNVNFEDTKITANKGNIVDNATDVTFKDSDITVNDGAIVNDNNTDVTLSGNNTFTANNIGNGEAFTANTVNVTDGTTTINATTDGKKGDDRNAISVEPQKNADSLVVAKGATLNINGKNTDVRGIVTSDFKTGTITINGTLNEDLQDGHSSAITAGNLNIGTTGTVKIITKQDNEADGPEYAGSNGVASYNGYHYGVITLGVGKITNMANANSTLTDNGSLTIIRKDIPADNSENGKAFAPIISMGSGGTNGSSNFKVMVGEGATLDIQDNAQMYTPTGITGIGPDTGVKSYNNAPYVGLINMWGTKSTDTLNFTKPKYVNLQRTGDQTGTLLRLEGGTKSTINLNGITPGGTPLSQWDQGNCSDNPSATWRVLSMAVSSGKGNYALKGFLNSDKKDGTRYFKDSNGSVSLSMDKKGNVVYTRDATGNEVQSSKTGTPAQKAELDNFLTNFNFWTPQRVAFGSSATIRKPTYNPTDVKQGETKTVDPAYTNNKNQSTDQIKVTYSKVTGDDGTPDWVSVDTDSGELTLSPTTSTDVGMYNVPVMVTSTDESDSGKTTENIVIAPVYVSDGNGIVNWAKDKDGNFTGAVVVTTDPSKLNAHETSNRSMKLNATDAVTKIEEYQMDTDDAISTTATEIAKNSDSNWDNITIAWDETKPSTNVDTPSMSGSTKGTVKVTFDTDSQPFADKVLGQDSDNPEAYSSTSDIQIPEVGATAADTVTPIKVPKNDYASGDLAKKYFTSDKVKNLINSANLDSYSDSHPDNKVTSYEILNPDDLDTDTDRNLDVTVRVNFNDGTHLDIPVTGGVQIYDGENKQYQPTYGFGIAKAGDDLTIEAPTWDHTLDNTHPVKYELVDSTQGSIDPDTGAITIPADKNTGTDTKDIEVKVSYDDGTSDTVHATAYVVKGAGTNDSPVKDPYSARAGVENPNVLTGATFAWATDENRKVESPDSHTTDLQHLHVTVTIDGKSVTVPTVVQLSQADPAHQDTVYGDESAATITVETPNYHKTTGSNTPTAPKVNKVDILDADGNTTETYTLQSDDSYKSDNGNTLDSGSFTTKWDTNHQMDTDTSNFNDDTGTTKSDANIEKDSTTGNSKYRVVLHWSDGAAQVIGIPAPATDDDSEYANVYANVYGATAASANDANGNLKAIHGVEDSLKDPSTYVDTTDLTSDHNAEIATNADGQPDITWKEKPNLDTVSDKVQGSVEIKFKDNSVLDVPITISVEKSEADKFNDANATSPLTHGLSYGKGYNNGTLDNSTAKDGIGKDDASNSQAIENYNIDQANFNSPVSTATAHDAEDQAATVTFKDGSQTTVNIPVTITDYAHTTGTAPVAVTAPVQIYQADSTTQDGKTLTPEFVISNYSDIKDKVSSIAWTTAPSTENPGTKNVEVTITYKDGTVVTVSGNLVTVEETVTPKVIELKQGVAATDEDANKGINENLEPADDNVDKTDGIPANITWNGDAPSTTEAGEKDVQLVAHYKDGFTHDFTGKVNVWQATDGKDEASKDPSKRDKDIYRTITRKVTVDGTEEVNDSVTFTRIKYTDTTDSTKNAEYSDWTAVNGDATFDKTKVLTKPGYTYTVAEGTTDFSGNPVKLADDGTIASETITKDMITADGPKDENIVITSQANAATVTISYVDKDGNTIEGLTSPTYAGKTDDKLTITKSADLKSLTISGGTSDQTINIPDGYKISQSWTPATDYSIPAKNGVIKVQLDKLTTRNPGDSDIDPNNADKDMFHDITREIDVIDPTTGKKDPGKSMTQVVHLQRTKTINETTGEVDHYGAWTFKDDNQQWDAFTIPSYDGYSKVTVTEDGTKLTTPVTKLAAKTFVPSKYDPADDSTIDKDVTVTITYAKTDADKFKDDQNSTDPDKVPTKTILVHQTKTNDPSKIVATDGIVKSDDYELAADNPVVWNDPDSLPDTAVVTPAGEVPTYSATVTFSDGSKLDDVQIPIKIWNDVSKFKENNNPDADHQNVLGQEIDYNKGTVVKKGDSAIAGFQDAEGNSLKYADGTSYDIKTATYNEDVDTSKVTDTTTPYDVYLVFNDGSKIATGVTVPVKILDKGDAAKFDNDNTADNPLTHTLSYGKGYNNGKLDQSAAIDGIGKDKASNSQTISDYDIDHVDFNEDVPTTKAHAAEGQAATITFKDKTVLAVNIPVEITDQASENADKLKTIVKRTDQGMSVEAEDVIDPNAGLPADTTYAWQIAPNVDTSGEQSGTLVATYPDGTKSDPITGAIIVEATPTTQTVTLKQGIPATDTDAETGITNLDKKGTVGLPQSAIWVDTPDTAKLTPGNHTIQVKVTYAPDKGGDTPYTKTVDVTVNVLKLDKGTDEAKKDPSLQDKNMVKTITRHVTVDGVAKPDQTITFTRDKYTDTTKTENNITYSDWKSDKSSFDETEKLNKDGYSTRVTGTDYKGNKVDTLTANGTIASETIDPKDPQFLQFADESFVITNTPTEQSVTIKYVDKSGNSVGNGDSFGGDTDQTVTITKDADGKGFKVTGDSIDDQNFKIPEGYKLDKESGLPSTYTIKSANNSLTVVLDKLKTLDPTDESVKSDPSNADMYETITREFDYTDPTTNKAKKDTQQVNYQRTKTINADDSSDTDVEYGEWKVVGSNSWDDYVIPTFDGYSKITVSGKDTKGNDIQITKNAAGQDIIASDTPAVSDDPTKPNNIVVTITYAKTEADKFNDDNKDAQTQQINIRHTATNEADQIDLMKGIKNPTSADYTITSVKPADGVTLPDTTVVTPAGDVPTYKSVVTFDDNSTVEVNIPIKIYDDATKFKEDNSTDNPLTQEMDIIQGTPTPAGSSAESGFSDKVQSNYHITGATFNEDVDTSKVTDSTTPYAVTINFEDGTSITEGVNVPVKIIAGDATKFNQDNNPTDDQKDVLTQRITVEWKSDPARIDATTGIKDYANAETKYNITSVNFNDPSKIDTTSDSVIGVDTPYDATVKFSDGSQTTVHIPVYVVDDATKYRDDHDGGDPKSPVVATQTVHKNLGSKVNASDAEQGLADGEATKYGIITSGDKAPKFNDPSEIDTSVATPSGEAGKQYAATIHFSDGSSLDQVMIPVVIDDKGNASDFQKANKDNALVQTLTWGKGTTHQASEAINGIKDPTTHKVTSATFNDPMPTTDEVHAAQNFPAEVEFEDRTSLTVQIPVAVTDQAGDTDVATKPIHVVVDPNTPNNKPVPDPKKGIDAKLPDGTKVEWQDGDPTVPDPGKDPITPAVKITYPDGTSEVVKPPLDSVWAPVIGQITTDINVEPDLSNEDTAKAAITNYGQGNGYPETLTWVTGKEPDVSQAGLTSGIVKVDYSDGYSTEVIVPVNVLGVEDGNDEKNHNDSDVYRDITRTINIEGADSPTVQHVIFTRIKRTDTTKTGDAQFSYTPWAIQSDNKLFAAVDVTKAGYTAKSDVDGKLSQDGNSVIEETPTADSQNEVINITYDANAQTVTINYVDAKDKTTNVGSENLQGKTDQTITIDPNNLKLPTSYALDDNSGLPDSYTFKASDNGPITVLVDHLTTTNPGDEGVDPDGKDSDMFETLKRNIHYTNPYNGHDVIVAIDSVQFQRSKTVNDQTGKVVKYGAWLPVNTTTTAWPEHDVPTVANTNEPTAEQIVDGKTSTLDVSSGKIAAHTVDPDHDKSTEIVLTYTLNDAGEFAKDNEKNALVHTIRVHKGAASVDPTDGVDKKTDTKDYQVTGVAWAEGVSVDTSNIGTNNYNAVITFNDKSTLTVSIPVEVYDDASDFDKAYKNDDIKPGTVYEKLNIPSARTDAQKAFSDTDKSEWKIVDSKGDQTTQFNEDVPTDTIHNDNYDATIVFEDGSTTTIPIPVSVGESDASADVETQPMEVAKGSKINPDDKDNATPALKNPGTGDNALHAKFVDPASIDTSVPGTTTHEAVVTFPDGSTKKVNVEVHVYTEADKFDENTIKPVNVIHGLTVKPEDAQTGQKDVLPDGATIKYIDDVETSEIGEKEYPRAEITFSDQSTKIVKVPVTVVKSDADNFDPAKDLKSIEVSQGAVAPTDATKHLVDQEASHVKTATYDSNTPITTTTPGAQTPTINLTFNDGSTKSVQSDVIIKKVANGTKYDPNSDEDNKYVTRTIEEVDPANNKVKYIAQTVHFVHDDLNGNSAYTDGNGKTVKVPWVIMKKGGSLVSADQAKWKAYTPTAIDGFKPSITGLDEEVVTPESKSKRVQVTYAIDFSKVTVKAPDIATTTDKSVTSSALQLFSKATGRRIEVPAGQLLFKLDKVNNGLSGATVDAKTGQITVPAGQSAKSYNISLIAENKLGETMPISTKLTVTDTTKAEQKDSDKYAVVTQPVTTEVGKLPDASSAIKNIAELPQGTSYAWQSQPDVSKAGKVTGIVVITYPDKSTATANVDITVNNPANTQDNTGTQQPTTPVGNTSATDATPAPTTEPDTTSTIEDNTDSDESEDSNDYDNTDSDDSEDSDVDNTNSNESSSASSSYSRTSIGVKDGKYNNSSAIKNIGQLGRTSASTREYNSVNTRSSNETLPNTGAKENTAAEAAGIAALGLSLIGLAGVKKRKRHE